MMTNNNAVLAIYESHAAAAAAGKELQLTHFDMKQLTIIAHDRHAGKQVVGHYHASDRMKYWGKVGAFWGLLFGSTLSFNPSGGPWSVAGPLFGWFLGALGGAAVLGGLSVLAAGLYSLGMPPDSVLKYATVPNPGKFVLVAQGTAAEVADAREIIIRTNPAAMEDHQPARVIMKLLAEAQPTRATPEECTLAA